MPAGDGTGPMGMGSMTGRAAGYCAGFPTSGNMNPVCPRGFRGRGRGGFGRGMGMGFGGGRGGGGRRRVAPYAAPYATPGFEGPTPQQERDSLEGQVEYLENALTGIRKRIAELEKTDPAEE